MFVRFLGTAAIAAAILATFVAPFVRMPPRGYAEAVREALGREEIEPRPGLIPDPFLRWNGTTDADDAYDSKLNELLTAQSELRQLQERILDGDLVDPADISAARSRRNQAESAVETARLARDAVYGFPANQEAGYRGALIQRDTLLVQFRRSFGRERINAFLARYGFKRRWEIEEISLVVLETKTDREDETWEGAATRLRAVADLLRKRTDVITAVAQNSLLSATSVPQPGEPPQKGQEIRDWFSGGDDPLIESKFPEAWNFNDAIRARGGRMDVGVLDGGFYDDLCDLDPKIPCDLRIQFVGGCKNLPAMHGTQMASIIGAGFDDGMGLDGASPFSAIYVCGPERPPPSKVTKPEELIAKRSATFEKYTAGLKVLLDRVPDPNPSVNNVINVINASVGYNWWFWRFPPSASSDAQQMIKGQGKIIRDLVKLYPKAVLVAAAGNECTNVKNCTEEAKWGSPFNWAALGGPSSDDAANVVVVEALDIKGKHLDVSSFGGNMLAIGDYILAVSAKKTHAQVSPGTSTATALVSATVAMMLAAEPSLDVSQIRTKLGVGSGQPLHAFDAVNASSKTALQDLTDLARPAGVVDKDDLRRFMVDYQQILNQAITGDLNRDGQFAYYDDQFCRIDLNGDGKVTPDDLSIMKQACNCSLP